MKFTHSKALGLIIHKGSYYPSVIICPHCRKFVSEKKLDVLMTTKEMYTCYHCNNSLTTGKPSASLKGCST